MQKNLIYPPAFTKDMIRLAMNRENENQLIRRAREIMKDGGTVAFPTDTLYGLGVDAELEDAVDDLYALKGRDTAKPISVMVPDIEALVRLTTVDHGLRGVLDGILPGPFTVILKSSGELTHVSREGKIGVRIPDHVLSRKLCTDFPVTATSANAAGMPSPRSAGEISLRVDLILDDGPTKLGLQSTVVDFTGRSPMVLRGGSGDRNLLNRKLEENDLPHSVLP